MYSPSGTDIVVSQQQGEFFFFAERMTSSTAVTVAAGDPAGVGPYRKQRVVSVFNYYAGTLDTNGNPMDQTSTLAVASNDLNGSGVWNRRLIPVASEVTTVTGTPDVTSTAWLHEVPTGLMPVSTMAIVAEGYKVTVNNDIPDQVFIQPLLVYVRSNDSGTNWQSMVRIPTINPLGNYHPDPSNPTAAIDERSEPLTVVAFIGNKNSRDASIGVVDAFTQQPTWNFSLARPGVITGPTNDIENNKTILAGVERVVMRSNLLIGPYLVADVQVPKPADQIGPGDGYCFPLVYRYDHVGVGANTDRRLDNSATFNSGMGDFARPLGYRCNRSIHIGNQTIPTAHVDFAVDPVMKLLVDPTIVGLPNPPEYRYVTYNQFASRGHIALTAFRPAAQTLGADGQYHDEVYYFNFTSRRIIRLNPGAPSRVENFEGGVVPLSNATAENEIAFQPTVSAMLDSVFITWYQYNATLGRFRLLGRRSTNRGSSWGPIRELNTLNPGQLQGVSAAVCATIPSVETINPFPIWSRFSGTVALFEGTPVGNMVQLNSRADPLAVTMFTSGRNGALCADQSQSTARYQEVNVAHWR